jgi:hypothetical protein
LNPKFASGRCSMLGANFGFGALGRVLSRLPQPRTLALAHFGKALSHHFS